MTPTVPAYRAGISVFDVMAGMHATIGILAALEHRHGSGEGQHVEVNLLSSALSGLVNHSSAAVAADVTPFRMGNAHPSLFPYEPLATADGEIIVIAGNTGQFEVLCEVLGIPDVAQDERFRSNEDRTARREELRPLLLEALATATCRGVVRTLPRPRPAGRTGQHRPRGGRVRRVHRARPRGRGRLGRRHRAVRPQPDHLLRDAGDLPARPPTLDEHHDELRAWLSEPRT